MSLYLRMPSGSEEAMADYRHRLAASHSYAVAICREGQDRLIGPDPLAEGAATGPASRPSPGSVLSIPTDERR